MQTILNTLRNNPVAAPFALPVDTGNAHVHVMRAPTANRLVFGLSDCHLHTNGSLDHPGADSSYPCRY